MYLCIGTFFNLGGSASICGWDAVPNEHFLDLVVLVFALVASLLSSPEYIEQKYIHFAEPFPILPTCQIVKVSAYRIVSYSIIQARRSGCIYLQYRQ